MKQRLRAGQDSQTREGHRHPRKDFREGKSPTGPADRRAGMQTEGPTRIREELKGEGT